MATIESTSTAAAPASPRKAPIKKEAALSATPVKKPVAAAKRAAKTAPAAKQVAETAKVALASPPAAKTAASAKLVLPKGANGKAAAKATALPAPEAKASKEKKQKMVRDSVTIPKAEYQALDAMKQRAAQLKTMVKKTELIRAGIKHLASLADAAFLAAIADVPSLKTGRPSKG